MRAEYASALALGRIPTGAEYADVAVFLLSELSRAVTGHVLDANGGSTSTKPRSAGERFSARHA
ncbi:SDR family oxidoreductase [Mycobacterium paraintracellulare]|uniref:SDR family oxidoreductase n=1 Tax=Mycobacterium paraintracellulare TaxID=1138383 RepID=UPI0019152F85